MVAIFVYNFARHQEIDLIFMYKYMRVYAHVQNLENYMSLDPPHTRIVNIGQPIWGKTFRINKIYILRKQQLNHSNLRRAFLHVKTQI